MDMTEEEIDSDSWFDVCRFDGVEAVVIGSVNKMGDLFVTDVKVLDVETKELIESASARGTGATSILASQIDELGKRISRIVGLSERKIEASGKSIREVTTTSMDAYNYFLRGREEHEKLRWEEAKKFLKMAVELDSTFAMAYLWLGRTYYYYGPEARDEATKKARAYSQKATEKEQMYIEADYALYVEANSEKQISILKNMTRKYPKEKRVYNLLAWDYLEEKYIYKATEHFKKALQLDPEYGAALNGLAYVYIEMEAYDEALEYLKSYVTLNPGDPNPLDTMAECYFYMGRVDEALAKYKEALNVDPDWGVCNSIAYIHAFQEEYSEGRSWLDEYISGQRSARNRAHGYMMKGLYDYLLGRFDRSIEEFDTAKALFKEMGNIDYAVYADYSIGWVYVEKEEIGSGRRYIRNAWNVLDDTYPASFHRTANSLISYGFLYLKEGKIDSARLKLTEVESVLPKVKNKKYWERWYHCDHELLWGMVLLKENKVRNAISVLEEATIRRPKIYHLQNFYRYILNYQKDALGQAYHQAGELDKAIAEYERITRFDPDNMDRRLIHPKYHYRLAKLYEEKGLMDKAIERYEKFLGFWKDADEDRPELIDARARLAKLKE